MIHKSKKDVEQIEKKNLKKKEDKITERAYILDKDKISDDNTTDDSAEYSNRTG